MIKVRVPATSANMGPGFDSVGVALNLYNEIEVCETDSGVQIIQKGVYKKNIPLKDNLVYKAMREVFNETGREPNGIKVTINTSVPATRGLGSSAACIVGGLVAANAVYGLLGPDDILSLACKMEGHPDNVVPCFTGGMAVSYYDGKKLTYVKHKMPSDIALLVLYPDKALETKKSRGVIPAKVPHKDAAFNAAHSALLVSSILTGKYKLLKTAMEDRLHQPYRMEIVEHMEDIFKLYENAGAYGWYLSGSGPTVAAVIPQKDKEKIMNKITPWAKENGFSHEILNFENTGAFVKKR